MRSNGYTFSHPEYERSFITVGSDDRSKFCAEVPASSYCGFVDPGDFALSITMDASGTADISYGASWGDYDWMSVAIALNGDEVDRVTGKNTGSYSMDVQDGDIISFSEYGGTVINVHSFIFTETSNKYFL